MKKIITLLLISLTFFTNLSFAQPGTACNAAFTFTVAGNTAQFNPTVTLTTVRHEWFFGDGSPNSSLPSPSHIFAPGIYSVIHAVSSANGVGCGDSASVLITISGGGIACNLSSNFSFVRDSSQANVVHFSNTSLNTTPNTIARWSFGDGSYSYENNPTHIFNSTGLFNVCLRVQRDSLCFDDTCKTVQIQLPSICNLTVNFSSRIDSANQHKVYFTNLSTPLATTDSITWGFGDGTYSHDINPSHIYSNGGTFTVCLRVKKANSTAGTIPCIREFCRQVTVQSNCNINPDFVFHRDTISANSFTFFNTTTSLSTSDSSFWDFGDGTPVIINPNNPVRHRYATSGNYTVCLKVKKIIPGSITVLCDRQVCKTIVASVPPPLCNLSVNFAWRQDSGNHRKIYFYNQSSPIDSITQVQWTFGDGAASNEWNPSHIFISGSSFTVCLRLTKDSSCSKDTCKVVFINDSTPVICELQPRFSYQIDSINQRKVIFTNASSGPVTTNTIFNWSFGDGNTSGSRNPQHVYTQPGNYIVCLTLSNSSACTRVACNTVVIGGLPFSCDSSSLSFVYRRDNYMPNKLYFFASGTSGITSQHWTFKRLGTTDSAFVITSNNPVHVFADTGLYSVCLSAFLQNGCTKEYCTTVRIGNITPRSFCFLQAYPNPARDFVNVNLQLAQPELITASVYNMQNIRVMQKTQQGFSGNNLLTINIATLPRGFYSMRIVYGNRVCYTRFHKF